MDDSDKEVQYNLDDIESRINAIKIIHDKILTPGMVDHIDSNSYITSLVSEILYLFSAGELELELDVDTIEFSSKQLAWIGILVSELVTNALKYGFKGANKKVLRVRLKETDGTCTLSVENNGEPIPEHVDVHSADSLGLTLVRGMAHQLRGELWVSRENSTEFTLVFPKDIEPEAMTVTKEKAREGVPGAGRWGEIPKK
jgi:two-component sensor histidine kinase